ncbi:hypothetical protein AcW1_008602 [Taiwanofungus camphoratus]|nr:hypothetical protein AcW1_008602 [Antrodia cinnamomea]
MSEILAVACVVDSSVTLAFEWSQLLQEYVMPLLQRFRESYPDRQFRIGFVSYATAETRPTPLLAKIFFRPAQILFKDMREHPMKLGIGQTCSGEARGMAALEGLVAAVELFDDLRICQETIVCHIVHIAAAPPDASDRPLWNMAPVLDNVTWETLPAEFRRRDICYSNILLKQLPRFPEFHALTAAGATQKPWFSVRPQHALHLSGFPASPQKGLKRPGEGPAFPERGSEMKRTRVQTHSTPASARIAGVTPQPATATLPASVPQPVAEAQPLPKPDESSWTPFRLKWAEQHLFVIQTQLRQKAQQAQMHEAAGRAKEAQALKEEVKVGAIQFHKLNQIIQQQKERLTRSGQISQSQSQHANLSEATGTDSSSNENTGIQSSVSAPQLQHSQPDFIPSFDVPMSDHALPTQQIPQPPPSQVTSSTGGAPGQSLPLGIQLPANIPSEMVAQMQKLLEQRSRVPSATTQQPQPLQQPQPPQAPPAPLDKGSAAGPSSSQLGGQNIPGQLVWRGPISLGPLDAGSQVVQVQAVVHAAHSDHLQVNTWPDAMTLTSSKDHTVPFIVLQEWMRKHKASLVYITAEQGLDAGSNEENFKALARVLHERNSYALAIWHGPSGAPETHIVIFPVKPHVLAGAFFPSPGAPELPPSEICGIPLAELQPNLALILTKIPEAQQTLLMQQPKERRIPHLMQLMANFQQLQKQQQQQHQQQQQQHQQQQQPSQHVQQPQSAQRPPPVTNVFGGLNPFFPGQQIGVSNILGQYVGTGSQQISNPTGGMSYNLAQMPQAGMLGALHRRNPSGSAGGVANLSPEMLQSFMQRNQENSGGRQNTGMGS